MEAEEIYKKMAAILKDTKSIEKKQKNKQQGWQFRGIDDAYNSLNPIFGKHGVFCAPHKIELLSEEKIVSKSGNAGYRVKNRYIFRFYAEDGSFVETEAIGEAVDYGDKSSNKAASIAHKYALLECFLIPTEDIQDPDESGHDLRYEPVKEPPPPRQAPPKTERFILTNDQLKRLYASAKGLEWTQEQLNQVFTLLGHKKTSEVSKKSDYDLILRAIEQHRKTFAEVWDELTFERSDKENGKANKNNDDPGPVSQ